MPESVLRFRVETADANRKVAQLEEQVRKLEVALKNSGGSSTKATTGLKAFSQGAGAAGVSAKALGAAVKGILGPLSLVATAAGAVVAGFKGFVEADKSRAAVRTLGVDVETLEGQLVGVVARTGGLASSNELLAASYDVASAGFGKAADIAKILEASLLGAVGGMTDINTVSDAATSVMNAFGLTTDSVSKIVDGFVQTQNDGKIVVGEYASQIGRVAPIAAAAGVGIDELNAAISTVTAQGVPVESTFAGLNQVIASVVKPTSEASKAAERLGLDFSSAAIQSKGFGGFLEDLVQKTGGSEVEITKLFGSVDALKALMPLINDDLVTFNKNLENQQNSSGAAADAAEIMGSTVSSQLSQIVNNVTTLVRALDQVLGPAVKGLLGLINSVLTAATAAVSQLTKMFQLNRARTQAREQLGGTMGRGTTKADPEEVEELAQEKVAKATAASVAEEVKDALDAANIVTQNNIVPTGGALSDSGKPDSDKEAENAKRIAEASADRVQSLKDQTLLASALTEEERTQFERQLQIRDIMDEKNGLSDEQRKAELDATKALHDQQDATAELLKQQEDRKTKAEELAAAERKAAEELNAIYQQVGDTISAGVVDALKGAVDSTTSLADAATKMLDSLIDQMLQLATNMMLFGNLTGTLTQGSGVLGSIFGGFMANGGTVSGGTSYIVGEKGPELFTPGRSGSITPNDALGGTNVMVNVDASGSNVQGNGQAAGALGSAIGAAVQAELIKQKRPGGLLY